MTIVGFTGTRLGCTEAQIMALHQLIERLRPTVWLHGACVGADEDGVVAVRMWAGGIPEDACPNPNPGPGDVRPEPTHEVSVVALPGHSANGPMDHSLQSQVALANSDEICPVQTHFARNREIVRRCEVLVACPGGMAEQSKGGTWYTVQCARRAGKRLIVLWPNGTSEEEP
jgi:hypothetical protein